MVDTVASDPPLPKLTPMLKLMPTVDTVDTWDTDMEVMVDTVVVMEVTDMVDTVARGPLMPNPMLRLTMVDTMVATDMVATDTAVDTVMVVMDMVDVTTDKFSLLRFYFFVKFVHLSKSSKRIKSLDAHQSQI